MKRALGGLLALVVLLVLWGRRPASRTADETPHAAPASPPALPQPAPVLPLGDQLLESYAQPGQTPEQDLIAMAHLMENYLLLTKEAARRPLSANEDWARVWRGADGSGERFLSDQHPALNDRGQVVDRWGIPLFFHAVGRGRFEVRSAGPDRMLWTEDDLHRNSDGTFRHGNDLNPPSLVEASRPSR